MRQKFVESKVLDQMESEEDLESDDEPNFEKPSYRELDHYEEDETDSETEALQEAFAQGILKPGLNVLAPTEKKKFANNTSKLKEKLKEIALDLPWLEKLDVISKPATIAPELAKQLEEDQEPIVRDDFKRESLFYRQAQAAVLEAIPRLHSLGIATKRPEDYFAEMAKSDTHMQKVKSKLIQQKAVTERIEKVRQIRKQKKLQKAIQAEGKLKKQNAKNELANEVKRFRKGERKDLGFLDDKPAAPLKRRMNKKRQKHDDKFGFGGRKRGAKRNTRESTEGLKKQVKGKPKMKRPGKDRRQNMRTKKR